MSSIKVSKRQEKRPEYYVYYNDWTGEIISVGRSLRNDISFPYIVTTSPVAKDIISGTKTENHYIVDLINKKKDIVKKADLISLGEENSLYLIPRSDTKDNKWNVRITFYAVNKKIVVELNPAFINRLLSYQARKELYFGEKVNSLFYIIKKDQPDFMLGVIDVDLLKLLRDRVLVFEYPEIERYVNSNDIDILTRRNFEYYSFRILNEKFIETVRTKKSYLFPSKWFTAEKYEQSHFDIIQKSNSKLVIKSNVNTEIITTLGITKRFLDLYVVKDISDCLLTSFRIDLSNVNTGSIYEFNVDFDLDEVCVLHQNPHLKINKGLEENVTNTN